MATAALAQIPNSDLNLIDLHPIPIVFMVGSNPVEIGLVATLNRPGGNLTGAAFLALDVAAKRLQLLHEMVPTAASITFRLNPTNPYSDAHRDLVRQTPGQLSRLH